MEINNINNLTYFPVPPGIEKVKSQGIAPLTILTSATDTVTLSPVDEEQMKVYTRMEDLSLVQNKIAELTGFDTEKGNKLISIASELAHSLSDENWNKFVTNAMDAGDGLDTFLLSAGNLMNETLGADESLADFFEFTDRLATGDLSNFLAAVEDSPEELSNLLDTAAKLTDPELTSFLEAASFTKDDLGLFISEINDLIDLQNEPGTLSTYLQAAAKTGSNVMEFINATSEMKDVDQNRVANFVIHELDEEELDNFIQYIDMAGKNDIINLVDMAESLGEFDRKNLLTAAAGAQNHKKSFIQAVKDFSLKSPDDFSNFLTTAANAEQGLGVVIKSADQIDFGFTATLSVVDTVNFLNAVQFDDSMIDELGKIGSSLSGEDKHLFLYAAAIAETGLDDFLTDVEKLEEEELSKFLLEFANQGIGVEPGSDNDIDQDLPKMDSTVYMKAILDEKSYANFEKIASRLDEDQVEDFKEMVFDLKGDTRTDFMAAATAAGPETGNFLTMFDNLSHEDRENLLDISSGLSIKNREKFIQASVFSGEDVSKFITLAGELKNDDATGQALDDFLTVASENPQDVKGLVAFTEQLNKGQRKSFLSAAVNSDYQLGVLMDLGEKILEKAPVKFINTFNAVAEGKVNVPNLIEIYSKGIGNPAKNNNYY